MTNPGDMVMGVSALGRAFRERRLSPVEVVSDALDRADESQASINAFTEICRERALEEARNYEAGFARGEAAGALAGIPISVKDFIATRGIRTAMGSLTCADNVPDADAISVERLRQAGAIIIGKTTTPEFACKQTTNAFLSGVTRNPWNVALSPGGSSGGSSASISLGIAGLSLVTDGGGSARLPAACTGVVGFKPTFGLVPMESAPDAFAGLGHIGLMAREVESVMDALPIVAGPYSRDAGSLARMLFRRQLQEQSPRPFEGLRIGWRERLDGEVISEAIRPVVLSALEALEELGGRIEPITDVVEPPLPVWQTLQHSSWAERHAHRLSSGLKMDPVIVNGIQRAETLSARDLQAAVHGRSRLFRQVQAWFDSYDVIVTPTLMRTPLPAEHPGYGEIDIDGKKAGDIRSAWAPMLGMFTMTGHPALSLNCGWTADGIPVGLQFVGRWYEDGFLLEVARKFQNSNPKATWRMPDHPPGAQKPTMEDNHAH